MIRPLSMSVQTHIYADTPIEIQQVGATQWVRIGDTQTSTIELFGGNAALARLRDALTTHLDFQAGGES